MNHKLLSTKASKYQDSRGLNCESIRLSSKLSSTYVNRIVFGHAEEIRALPVEYLSTTSQSTIPMHPPGWNPCDRRPCPCLSPVSCWKQWHQWDRTQPQWVRGASACLSHSIPGKQGNEQDQYFLPDLHLIIGALGVWKPHFCACFGRGKKSTHIEGLLPAASHANTAREKIAALCAKPFKPKCRIWFACGFLQGNSFCTKVTQLSANAVLRTSRSQPNTNNYIKDHAIQNVWPVPATE